MAIRPVVLQFVSNLSLEIQFRALAEDTLTGVAVFRLGLVLFYELDERLSMLYFRYMFKTVIAPIQAWLLSQGRCVGCGTELSLGKKKNTRFGEQVTCVKCGRIFIHDVKAHKYRRALLEEV